MPWQLPIGAQVEECGVRFRVWAPDAQRLEVVILGARQEEIQKHALERDEQGFHSGLVPGLRAGANYMYRLDGDRQRPDPASRYQPEGVHRPSQVVDPSTFGWTDDAWNGIPLEKMVVYEAHVGTATPRGTFDALIEKLPYLKDLGVTTLELMPVADFPGERNWGYDGVCLYAPARAYGGPEAMKELINAAHEQGLAVVQDVVYNHLGPDGNYLREYGKSYFTDEKKTPWGDALNYEQRQVRDFFIDNAIYWAQEFHVDGLRLDATHAILDDSEKHLLQELTEKVRASLPVGRQFVIFAEDHRNICWILIPVEKGGAGIDSVWADDFHHEIRVALAGDREGYYMDYDGTPAELSETFNKGWLYTGQLAKHRGRTRGEDASEFDPPHFLYCIQNHDQTGNRAFGDRLNHNIPPEAYRVASAMLLLSPATPLLFQGQEWAASSPFMFFTDFDPDLGRLVTVGRREEFAHFQSFKGEQVPDPQALSTFEESKLRWDELDLPGHKGVLELYKETLKLRESMPALQHRTRQEFKSSPVSKHTIAMRYSAGDRRDALLLATLKGPETLDFADGETLRPPDGCRWQVALSTEESRFGGMQDVEALQREIDEGRLTARGPMVVALQAVA